MINVDNNNWMPKPRTSNLPDLSSLAAPADDFVADIQRTLLRGSGSGTPALSIAEQIASRLAASITLDLIKPGQRVLEQDLAAVLGVSRAPIREALRILERDRLVVVVPRRGAHVTTYSRQELRNVFEIRASLMGTLVDALMLDKRGAFEHVLAAGIAQLESVFAIGSRDAYALASFQLVSRICELSDNRLLADMVRSLALQTLRYARLGFDAPNGVERSLRDWRAIARAARADDRDKVVTLVRGRVLGSRDAASAALGAPLEKQPESHTASGPDSETGDEDGDRFRGPLRGARVAPRARAAARR